jgi:hypothetical protein
VLLGGSSLTFGSLGAVIHGKTLTFTEAAAGAAFRLLGNYSSDAASCADRPPTSTAWARRMHSTAFTPGGCGSTRA